ncbi:spermatogenesis-associated protein 13 [Arthroderma uncinatum]|uniref:spermatogenesis-associated protein 13 n=1 Tax=Arthroderma uncinatum TaxID=74035 RepID=UPI00144A87A6|nr:spermatogenesis-associated protein 13 [Arthroderma uncinatum]KAF3481824.1 spermatogenesis-associated protein 13 [Arthroderma uncinatum]
MSAPLDSDLDSPGDVLLPQTTYEPPSSRDDAFPDPHDFYLQYHPFDDQQHLQHSHNQHAHGQIHQQSPPRARKLSDLSPSKTRRALLTATATPTLTTASASSYQNRQSSLQDLVNKFNQTPDEVVPKPSAASIHAHARTNTAFYKGHPRPPSATATRRPLFGEIIPRQTSKTPTPSSSSSAHYSNPHSLLHPGSGPISSRGRGRSGSDSCMHTPKQIHILNNNAAFEPQPHFHPLPTSSSSSSHAADIVDSPTAWYLPALSHRRSRSDLGSPVSPQLNMHPHPISTSFSSRQSQYQSQSQSGQHSRIPLPSRRASQASDSGNSSPSTRTNSALDRYAPSSGLLPPKGVSLLPKPSPTSPRFRTRSSSTNTAASSTTTTAAGSRRHIPRDQKSPTLQAFITAPLPKKSPPLRSSRPRQPVSSATTTASRARLVERISGLQSKDGAGSSSRGSGSGSRSSSKKPPELGNVDFAARRQRIQQAFNRTVEENAKKEERAAVRREREIARKMARLQPQSHQEQPLPQPQPEAQALEEGLPSPPEEPQQLPSTVPDLEVVPAPVLVEAEADVEPASITLPEQTPAEDEGPAANNEPVSECVEREFVSEENNDSFVTPDEGRSPILLPIAYNPDQHQHEPPEHEPEVIAEHTDVHIPNMTLHDYRPKTPESDNTDTIPQSAVTVGTEITTFDPEPQDGLVTHRTMLNHIMQMRESSPSVSSTSDGHDDHDTEHEDSTADDGESIRIMLRRSRYLDSIAHGVGNPQHRWSMSSWNSSFQEHPPSRDVEIEVEDADSKLQEDSCDSSHSLHENATTPQPIFPPSPPCETDDSQTDLSTKHGNDVGDGTSHSLGDDAVIASLERRFSMNMANHYTTIAKQARWDSKRATQLYLQELAKAGYERPRVPILTPGSSESEGKRLSAQDSERRGISSEREGEVEAEAEDGVLVPDSATIPTAEFLPARASLHLRDDWETSPSIADWMHLAAGEDEMLQQQQQQQLHQPEHQYQQHQRQATDVTEILHTSTSASTSDQEGAETPKMPGPPQFASIDSTVEGLGLEIRVQSPQDGDSPTLPSPFHMHLPAPSQPPPPPPPTLPPATAPTEEQPAAFEASPSVYTNSPPSSVMPALPTFHDAPPSSRSEDSSLHITPPQTISSSTSHSQEQPSSLAPETTSLFHDILDPASRKSPTPEQRRLKKRRNVIKELVDTEYTFGQDMTVVVDIYKGTSSSCLGLSPEDVKTLFGNSEQVVQFSMDWQDALKQAAKSIYVLPKSQRWSSKRSSKCTQNSAVFNSPADPQQVADEENDRKTSIGEAFMANIERMEAVYSDYLRNHDAANRTLEALLKNKNVNIWLKECREWAADLTSAWNLDSLLVKPVQRILKYPLLLTELLSATPADHPDHAAISSALAATTAISVRINEMKKRADLVGQVVGNSRKRKESDVRAGLSKAFGRRTEKLKQHVGITEMFSDKDYDSLSQRFGDNFFQLQLVMRDVEGYLGEVQTSMGKFNEFIVAVEGYITLAPSNYPELESKWCRFRLAVKDVMAVALVDHVAQVRKSVVTPMVTLLKLHDGPQRVMQKRNKRLMDYVKYKAIKDRGDKPDKKITEQGEQFVALNMALKDELPRLLSLTGKLMEACLNAFVQTQATWLTLVQKRLGYTIDRLPQDINQIISDWSGDFSFSEAQVLSLGVCNGSILADTTLVNNYSSPPPSHGADTTSSRRPSTVNSATGRTFSGESGNSPKVSHDFGSRSPEHSIQTPPSTGFMQHGNGSYVFQTSDSRTRANSTYSVGPPALSNGHIPSIPSIINPSTRSSVTGPSGTTNASFRMSDTSPKLPQLALDTPRLEFFPDHLMSSSRFNINVNGLSNNTAPDPADHPSSPSAPRYSGFFSSAMPMPETPEPSRFVAPESHNSVGSSSINPSTIASTSAHTSFSSAPKEPSILFLAASMFEFNIDRARREAGYPYLTYVAGEIFDVIGEKGDLWLARNQDDPTHQVGWIWTKHFAKLAG